MISLSETYKVVLLEGENEDQAEKILKKASEERAGASDVSDLLNTLKRQDPTEQNKYIPILARIIEQSKANPQNFNPEAIKNVPEGLQAIEELYGATLQYSKNKGLFFNKDIEDFDIKAGEGMEDPMEITNLVFTIQNIYDTKNKIEKLKQAKRKEAGSTPKVDGKATTKVFENKNVQIYAGEGKQACIQHSKGTNWCIGEPKSGHYEEKRQQGSSFYFIYDYSVEGAGERVVVEVKAEDNEFESYIEEINVHDKRNAEDDKVEINGDLLNTEEYMNYLKESHGVDTKLFEPIPPQGEEDIEHFIENAGEDELIGQYYELKDGTIIDLTLALIKHSGLELTNLNMIKRHPVAKKFLKDYIWTAIMNNDIDYNAMGEQQEEEFFNQIPTKLINKYIKKIYDYSNGNTNDVIRQVPSKYFEYASYDVINELAKKHLLAGKDNILPESILKRMPDEIALKNAETFINRGVPPTMRSFEVLSEEGQMKLVDKVVDTLNSISDEKAKRLHAKEIFADLITVINEGYKDDVISQKVWETSLKKLFEIAKETGAQLPNMSRPSNPVRELVGEEEWKEYIRSWFYNTVLKKVVMPDQFKRMMLDEYDLEIPLDYLKVMITFDKYGKKEILDLFDEGLISREKAKEAIETYKHYIKSTGGGHGNK